MKLNDAIIEKCNKLTIAQLNFIIQNKHTHSYEEVNAAKLVIEQKRADLKEKNTNIVREIDGIIRKEQWFEFHIVGFDGYRLTVGGGVDLTYSHNLEIIFEDVFFVSAFFRGWTSDTTKTVFQIPGNEVKLNMQYEIEQDYQLFVFSTEDYKSDIIIAANNVSFNTDTVFYYNRPDLKENERLADFVKKKSAM